MFLSLHARTAAPTTASESTFGLLHALKGEEAGVDASATPSGPVLPNTYSKHALQLSTELRLYISGFLQKTKES